MLSACDAELWNSLSNVFSPGLYQIPATARGESLVCEVCSKFYNFSLKLFWLFLEANQDLFVVSVFCSSHVTVGQFSVLL